MAARGARAGWARAGLPVHRRRLPARALLDAGSPPSGIEVHVTSPLPVHDAAAYEGRLARAAAWLAPRAHTVALVNTFRAFPGADLAERHGLPVVWAVHESWPEPLIWAFDHPGVAVDPAVRAIAAGALARAGAVVFESEATRALYEDRAPGRTVFVPYGVDTAALDAFAASTTPATRAARARLDRGGLVLLAMGTIEPRKGQTPPRRGVRRWSPTRTPTARSSSSATSPRRTRPRSAASSSAQGSTDRVAASSP